VLLKDKVAVVTGSSRGIGRGIARRFAQEGAKVVVCGRALETVKESADDIRRIDGTAHEVVCDVTVDQDVARLFDETLRVFGPVDILVNNAALNYYIPIVDYPASRWVRSFAVNVHGPFMLSKLVLPDMIEKHEGAIVNISSGAAIGPGRGPYEDQTVRGGTMYGASKAALERFSQGLAQEVAAHNIAVTALSPSQVVPTPGTVFHKLVEGLEDPRGEPPEYMARATLLLASEGAAKVTGRVTYSQQILKEFGWIDAARGTGVDRDGSGYSLS
jgi:NAD(P)-dependent dehydrogenase (short-subunit alcohol dehydrogenase family)